MLEFKTWSVARVNSEGKEMRIKLNDVDINVFVKVKSMYKKLMCTYT